MNFVLLIAGLLLLIGSGEALVKGAVSLAKRCGVSPLVIGMTIIALGTSAPELAVNIVAALAGNSDISFGNIIGSNIANIGLIIGVTALIRPLRVERSIVTREIPIMIGFTLLMLLLMLDPLIGDQARSSRLDGGILLLGLCSFLYMMVLSTKKYRDSDAYLREAEEEADEKPPLGVFLAIVFTLIGLAGMIIGSRLTVKGAVAIAEAMGVSEAIIGLTMVALGTSLPELTTSVMAARRGHAELAVGNVIGSNILNLLLILGVTSLITPIDMPAGGLSDLAVMTFLSLLMLPLAITHRGQIVRWEGALLLVIYLGYIGWRWASKGGAVPV